MKKIVVGKNIVKSFGEGSEKNKVLCGVTVEIEAGEFVAIMGPSGSGKSTLMYALSGMDGIDEGTVTFDEKELAGLSENELADIRRKEMGFVFQQPTLLKNLNIIDNIILPSMRDNRRNTSQIIKKAEAVLMKTGIAELADRDISKVSGGQLQRAGICRALMNDPKVIFGDEPTGALNSKSAQDIMNILGEINREGTAVVVVTHDPKVAARAGRVLFMQDGEIVSELKIANTASERAEIKIKRVTDKMQAIGI